MTSTTDYTKVIALNNIGIALLDRGSYQKAVSAFKSAVNGIEAVSVNDDEDQLHCPSLSSSKRRKGGSSSSLSRQIRKACTAAETAYLEPLKSLDIPVSRVACHDGMILFPSDRSLSPCLRLIQIEMSSLYGCSQGYTIEKAVLYSNLGLASYLLAHTVVVHDDDDALYKSKLLLHANDMFAQAAFAVSDIFGLYEDQREEIKVLSIALLVTGNIIEVRRTASACESDIEMHNGRYKKLREAIQTIADPEEYTTKATNIRIDPFFNGVRQPSWAPALSA